MKLTIRQHIVLNIFTLIAFLCAPILLVWGLIAPIGVFVFSQIWSALNFPHDVRTQILINWGKLDLRGNEIEPNKMQFSANSGGSNNGKN
jgi:hypothetical protein